MLLVSSFMLIQASQQAPKRGKTETEIAKEDAQQELNKAAGAQVAQQNATSSQDSDSDDFDDFNSPSSSPVPMSYVIGWTKEELAEFDLPRNKIYVTKEQIANCGYKQADVRSFSTDQQGQNSSKNQ